MIFLLTHRDAVRLRRCRRATLAGAVLLAQAMGSPAALALPAIANGKTDCAALDAPARTPEAGAEAADAR
jgi:hypothetical protein